MKLTTCTTADRLAAGTTTSRPFSGGRMPWLANGVFGIITPHPLRPDGRQVLRPG